MIHPNLLASPKESPFRSSREFGFSFKRNPGDHHFNHEKARKLGKYLLGDTIGSGSFGKVKIGLHVGTQQKVAIKVLEKNKITRSKELIKLTRELKILKKAKHPNIAQLYEVGSFKSPIEIKEDRNINR